MAEKETHHAQMDITEVRARSVVVECLGVDPDKVTLDASFVDDLGADSLDIIELVMTFEEEFGIGISDEDFEKVTTFGDALKIITGLL